MDGLLLETLDLQRFWTAKSTPKMERRGILVRNEIPAWIRERLGQLEAAVGIADEKLQVEGRDATGLKSEVPWARVYSEDRSPSATTGWYLVYLFSAGGDRVYLTLIQGSTRWTGQQYAPREPRELMARARWARSILEPHIAGRTDLLEKIKLDIVRSKVGGSYEKGSVLSIEYSREKIPGPHELEDDLRFMAGLLGVVYRAEDDAAYVPGDTPPEVVEVEVAAARAAGRRRPVHAQRQGRGLNAEERKAVELHGVRLATEHFQSEGWAVKDVGATESYDLLLDRGVEHLHVEVKGTTSLGQQIVLTRAEVEKQLELHPANALVIVHSIDLDRTTTPPTASGGTLHCIRPWSIGEEDLSIISYVYKTGL
ncbi:MrcB family domain-containing protein [Actinocorallia libanotica]|uniref:DUF3578 domain-containing protein n=1 Tax=Actinocorallia libanotica TaxID=46162 RepID=A0ABP4BU32_9ACTN